MYIQSAQLNNQELNKAWFYHSDFEKGGDLEIMLGNEPNKDWGAKPEDLPPSD